MEGNIDNKLEQLKDAVISLYNKENLSGEDLNRLKIMISENNGVMADKFSNELGSNFNNLASAIQNGINDFIKNLEDRTPDVRRLSEDMTTIRKNISQFDFENKARFEKIQTIISDTYISQIKGMLSELSQTITSFDEKHGESLFLLEMEQFKKDFSNISQNLAKEMGENSFKMSSELKTFQKELEKSQRQYSDSCEKTNKEVEKSLEEIKKELNVLVDDLNSYNKDFSQEISSNLKAITDPLKNAVTVIENLSNNTEIKAITNALEGTKKNIEASFETLTKNFNSLTKGSHLEVLENVNLVLPVLVDKLEFTRADIVSENTNNIDNLKKTVQSGLENLKDSISQANEKSFLSIDNTLGKISSNLDTLIHDRKEMNEEFSQSIKIDLQKVSDYMVEALEETGKKSQKKLEEQISKLEKFLNKINSFEDTVKSIKETFGEEYKAKMENLESVLINLHQEVYEKLGILLSQNYEGLKKDLIDEADKNFEYTKGKITEILTKITKVSETSMTKEQADKFEKLLIAIQTDVVSSFEGFKSEMSKKLQDISLGTTGGIITEKLEEPIEEITQWINKINSQQIQNEKLLKKLSKIEMILPDFSKIQESISLLSLEQEKNAEILNNLNKMPSKSADNSKTEEILNVLNRQNDEKEEAKKILKRIVISLDKHLTEQSGSKGELQKQIEGINAFLNEQIQKQSLSLEQLKVDFIKNFEEGFKEYGNKNEEIKNIFEDLKNQLNNEAEKTSKEQNRQNEELKENLSSLKSELLSNSEKQNEKNNELIAQLSEELGKYFVEQNIESSEIKTQVGETSRFMEQFLQQQATVNSEMKNEFVEEARAIIKEENAENKDIKTILVELKNYFEKKEKQEKQYPYSLLDVESDIAKLKVSISEFSKEIKSDLQTQTPKYVETFEDSFSKINMKIEVLTNYISKNIKSEHKFSEALTYLGNWADDTTEAIAYINQNLTDNASKPVEVKENNNVEVENKLEDLISLITKKFKQQEVQIKMLEDKLGEGSTSNLILDRLDKLERKISKIAAYVDEE